MYFESHLVHVNVPCICFVFYTCLFVHCCELDFIYARAIFNLQTCVYANGSLLASPICYIVNPEMLSTKRFYDGNAMYRSHGLRNCQMLICIYEAFL